MLNSVMKLAAGLAIAAATVTAAFAADLAAPKGDVVLSLTGAITQTNAKATANFDMDMLKAMPAVTFKTATNWTKGETTFTGVSLKALLAAVGAKGKNLHSIALNDYAVDIPVADAVDGGPIVAYLMDGKPMSPRDKGPLWVVYPFDSNAAYKTEEVYSRAIWQLSRIDVQ
ncbi:MAG: molybdopterin-dependent oxidoreductase [Alphaproteobacteria bacterium]|nr:molybdopterin-dependent oxidoreductase [Alphaproteobacteria bacterium]